MCTGGFADDWYAARYLDSRTRAGALVVWALLLGRPRASRGGWVTRINQYYANCGARPARRRASDGRLWGSAPLPPRPAGAAAAAAQPPLLALGHRDWPHWQASAHLETHTRSQNPHFMSYPIHGYYNIRYIFWQNVISSYPCHIWFSKKIYLDIPGIIVS